jgi:protein-S-isoprenylcysteine O-methyltransferase Ste14
MNNKIPPPIVTLFFGLCIFFSKSYFPDFNYQILNVLSLISILFGIYILFLAVRLFNKQNTTVNPIKIEKASSLVVAGIFQYSRNPMYLGMLFVLIGLSFKFNLIGGIIFTLLFMLFITAFQIKPEEQTMDKLFGDEFKEYKKKVRMWL